MNVFSLPALPPTATVETALDKLEQMSVGTLVLDAGPTKMGLIFAGDLITRDRNTALGSIARTTALYEVQDDDQNAFGLDFAAPFSTSLAWECLLLSRGYIFGMPPGSGTERLVISYSESAGNSATMPDTLICDGPPMHGYPPGSALEGDDCYRCRPLYMSKIIRYRR